MSRLSSFPKIFNLGHDAIERLFDGTVEITEKVDGSQFRFGIDSHNELMFGSKGVQLYNKDQNGMFNLAIEQIEKRKDKLIALRSALAGETGNPDIELVFYGEYLNKPKHNVLAYERTPKDNIILFAVKEGENFISYHGKIMQYAEILELETVNLIFRGEFNAEGGKTRYDKLKEIITTTTSALGKQIIEGVVIKNYSQFHFMAGSNPSPCFGKYVREDFKETLHKEWGTISGKNALQEFIDGYKSEARWEKAIQHLREAGQLENSPRDIGNLMIEVKKDIVEEEKSIIEKFLYRYFINDILRRAIGGLPEWYKDQLLKKQCEDTDDEKKE